MTLQSPSVLGHLSRAKEQTDKMNDLLVTIVEHVAAKESQTVFVFVFTLILLILPSGSKKHASK